MLADAWNKLGATTNKGQEHAASWASTSDHDSFSRCFIGLLFVQTTRVHSNLRSNRRKPSCKSVRPAPERRACHCSLPSKEVISPSAALACRSIKSARPSLFKGMISGTIDIYQGGTAAIAANLAGADIIYVAAAVDRNSLILFGQKGITSLEVFAANRLRRLFPALSAKLPFA